MVHETAEQCAGPERGQQLRCADELWRGDAPGVPEECEGDQFTDQETPGQRAHLDQLRRPRDTPENRRQEIATRDQRRRDEQHHPDERQKQDAGREVLQVPPLVLTGLKEYVAQYVACLSATTKSVYPSRPVALHKPPLVVTSPKPSLDLPSSEKPAP